MLSRTLKKLSPAGVGLLLTAIAVAEPTVQTLFQSTEDTLGHPLGYPGAGTAEITGELVTLLPGDGTGWHYHPAPVVAYLLSGELTVDYATGETRVFRSGDGVIEAQHTPHIGHNHGAEPVRMVVFAAGAPGVPVSAPAEPPRPDDFVALNDIVPDLVVELRYYGSDNFVGRPVDGYEAEVAYLTRDAAAALRAVQEDLSAEGLGLKLFDAYRPQRAVDDFLTWAADPDDTKMKAAYYPTLDKSVLVPNGYIAERSGHSRGSTVDVTLVRVATGAELDMGSPYDFFDPISWPSSALVTASQSANRRLLRETMQRHGFVPLEQEWWHFTLRNEPYPDTSFDFPVR